jgi:hypothetical protein
MVRPGAAVRRAEKTASFKAFYSGAATAPSARR